MLIVGSAAGLAKCRHIAFCNCAAGLLIFHIIEYSEIFLCLNTDVLNVLVEVESHGWLIRRGDDAGGEV